MKIVLATGIYPPQIGGPATYCHNLAAELTSMGHEVVVITYGGDKVESGKWKVESVSKSLPIVRWFSYAKKLQQFGADADVVYCFSSVSTGVPLILSGLKNPKRVLRLGGDFFWERYTALGGKKGLREWYEKASWQLAIGNWLLRTFDHIVFSTEFQQHIYQDAYKKLPPHSVIENALQIDQVVSMKQHYLKKTFRLLFVGRFVAFKNIPALLHALVQIPNAYLTLVGDGPQGAALRTMVEKLGITTRVQFAAPLNGKEKYEIFAKHDLLVLPSITEISPNIALEARSTGLPILLSKETGLSESLRKGFVIADLSTPSHIAQEIERIRLGYSFVAEAAAQKIAGRSWSEVASETADLFATLCAT